MRPVLLGLLWASLAVECLNLPLACAAPNQGGPGAAACTVLADQRVEEPLRAIVAEFRRRRGAAVTLRFLPVAELDALVRQAASPADAAFSMPPAAGQSAVAALPGATKVAWKYPSGEPVWAAPLGKHPSAVELIEFAGGPSGHQLWSQSKAGFTMTSGKTHAEAYQWVVEHRTGHTYPITAARMLRECGNVQEGICIDIGCASGELDIELAKRSKLKIIGLDIDPDCKPLFEKRVREAGLQDRLSFVVGDAQKLPFPDDYADLIVSRGTLTFIPDIGKCLREVDRVLKPTGVAFLGGRYLYTPQKHKISTEQLRKIVRDSGVAGAEVIDARGQWVKIVGPQAPAAARQSGLGPTMLAERFVADYAITEGTCLLICPGDSSATQALAQGFLEFTGVKITALYPSEKVAAEAEKRIRAAKLGDRLLAKAGDVHALPFADASFDVVAGIGPILLQGDRETAMREIYRVLRPGGAALVGGRFLGMPDARKVTSDQLRTSAARTGIPSVRVVEDMGQWVEIRKGPDRAPGAKTAK